jgi:pre-mRNA-splicing factor CWC22
MQVITGIVNRVNMGSIKYVVPEPFSENLIRACGLSHAASSRHMWPACLLHPVFAALDLIINTKLPMMGELLLHRLISGHLKGMTRYV